MAALISLKRSDIGSFDGLVQQWLRTLENVSRGAVACVRPRPKRPAGCVCVLAGIAPPERVWAISIARLSASPRLHLRPIDVIVSDGPCVEILS